MQLEADPMLDVALSYVRAGIPVFPCRAEDEATDRFDPETGEEIVFKAKTPLTGHGFKGATKFPHNATKLWERNRGAIIGIPTGEKLGAWVLDVDVHKDENGETIDGYAALAALEDKYGKLPDTARVRTAGGGLHYYFEHVPGVRNRGRLDDGLDVRGTGGYVVAAGSSLADGRCYEWVDHDGEDLPVFAQAPDWLLELVLPKPVNPTASNYRYDPGSNDYYIEVAVQRELEECESTPMGAGRNIAINKAAFSIGTLVGAGGIAESEARALLQDVARSWGRDLQRSFKSIDNGLKAGMQKPRSIPEPHNDNTRLIDISRMIENGLRKGREAKEEEEEAKPEHAAEVEESAFRLTPFSWIDPKNLARREFAFGTHYIRKYVSVTVSPGGLGKTSNSIVEALAMASGRQLAGVKPNGRLRVSLFNAEDPRDEMERRIMAACLHFGLTPDDINGHLFLDTGREQELVIMHEDRKTGVTINEPIVEAVVENIERNEIDVLIVDPFVSTHRVNENDNGAIDRVAKLWAQIADYTNCAVDVVHHLRKVSDREATIEDARGAVSLLGAARSVRVLNRMSSEQATRAGISEADRFSYFWIHYGKANLTRMDNSEHWRKLESVALGNGRGLAKPQDFAGVVTEWKWPTKEQIAAEVPSDAKQQALVKLANQNYRESSQSEDWAGYVLADALGIDCDVTKAMTPEKRKVKAVLDAWLDSGVLSVSAEDDPRHLGRKVKYIRPA